MSTLRSGFFPENPRLDIDEIFSIAKMSYNMSANSEKNT